MDASHARVEHLKMTQGVIDRLADNCARAKTWTAALAAAVLVFAGAAPDPGWPVAAGG